MNPWFFTAMVIFVAVVATGGGFLAGFVVGMEEMKNRLKGKVNCSD